LYLDVHKILLLAALTTFFMGVGSIGERRDEIMSGHNPAASGGASKDSFASSQRETNTTLKQLLAALTIGIVRSRTRQDWQDQTRPPQQPQHISRDPKKITEDHGTKE
jgi:hypothetical protein